MRFLGVRLALSAIFVAVAITYWPVQVGHALPVTHVSIMSSKTGTMTHAGLHFDDGTLGAYDYGGSYTAYLRGMLPEYNTYIVRYQYWDEGICRVRGRMQRWVNSAWYTDYDHDVDIFHLNSRPAYVSYTQQVQANGAWFYASVGTASECASPGEAHSHLGVTFSSYMSNTYKSSDTCWANNSECNIMGGRTVAKHGNNPPPPYGDGGLCPGQQNGTATNLSGGVIDPYACQEWSYVNWNQDSAVFDAH